MNNYHTASNLVVSTPKNKNNESNISKNTQESSLLNKFVTQVPKDSLIPLNVAKNLKNKSKTG